MTDFEARVAEALTTGAADAPDTHGLADAARARRRARVRRRGAGSIAVVVFLAVAVPIGVVGLRGGDDGADPDPMPAVRVVDVADDGWQTVRLDDTTVEIPPGWVRPDGRGCDFSPDYAPPASKRCNDAIGVSFSDSATADYGYGPGVRSEAASGGLSDAPWSGHAPGGTWSVYAGASDRSVVTRILASVRDVGPSPAPPETTRVEEWRGLTVEVPVSWFAQQAPCVRGAEPRDPAIEFPANDAHFCARVTQGYGARFFEVGQGALVIPLINGQVNQIDNDQLWPRGSWVGSRLTGLGTRSPAIVVVAPDRTTAQAVLDSARYRGKPVPHR